ncbi:MAG: response regulator [Candidatus Planktophila sp.]|nr:response regulator [Candidatus Planktophila sp.]
MRESKRSVLVIDDNEDIRHLLTLILENAGFTVLTGIDGADGLAQTRSAKPDLILLDAMMPGLNGFEVLEKIRKDRDSKINSIPVLMLTSRSSVEDIDMAIDLGATSYVVKPFRPEKLVQKVISIFESESS